MVPPWTVSHVLALVLLVLSWLTILDGSFRMFTYCPKDPHYVLPHCLLYMIILFNHVTW